MINKIAKEEQEEQLVMGEKVEGEHAQTIVDLIKQHCPNISEEELKEIVDETKKNIAKDHLKELPNYYTLLKEMEDKAKSDKKPTEAKESKEASIATEGIGNLHEESQTNVVRKDTSPHANELDMTPGEIFGDYPVAMAVSTGFDPLYGSLAENTKVYVANDEDMVEMSFIKQAANGDCIVKDQYGQQFTVSQDTIVPVKDYQNLNLFQ